jgi:hypothetical protein
MNVYIKPAAGAGSVVTNSVAELKKKIVLLCAVVNVDAAVNVVTVSKPVIAPIKPFVDVTGPVKVVEAMMYSSHASCGYVSACRQPELSAYPIVFRK